LELPPLVSGGKEGQAKLKFLNQIETLEKPTKEPTRNPSPGRKKKNSAITGENGVQPKNRS